MRVLILGSGPAGLMAAHAAHEQGAELHILSKRQKSPMLGAQYLHAHIPGTSARSFLLDYKLLGTVEGYREKVYGVDSEVDVSPEALLGTQLVWDIRDTYDELWGMYGEIVTSAVVDSETIAPILDEYQPDLAISTIPATALCGNQAHTFERARIWVTPDANGFPLRSNLVLCSGLPEDGWYRKSRIQGYENTEWPFEFPGAAQVLKPISNDCDCHPEFLRMGRYGNWTKGVLSHEAYFQTQKEVREWRLMHE